MALTPSLRSWVVTVAPIWLIGAARADDVSRITDDELAVYGAAVDWLVQSSLASQPSESSRRASVEVDAETFGLVYGSEAGRLDALRITKEKFPTLMSSTLNAHDVASRDARAITPTERIVTSYRTVTRGEPPQRQPCEQVPQPYPDWVGIVAFTRVGFSLDHTQALLFYLHTCDPHNEWGRQGYLLLGKGMGRWTVVASTSGPAVTI
jgi:hypothetical protein